MIKKIIVKMDELAKMHTDVVVNVTTAMTPTLLGNAYNHLCMAAGYGLMEECKDRIGLAPGDTLMTGGYMLPAKHILHTAVTTGRVEPIRGREERLTEVWKNCLARADYAPAGCCTVNLSIAFPDLSAGTGYPLEDAAGVAVKVIKDFLVKAEHLREVYVVCDNGRTFCEYKKQLEASSGTTDWDVILSTRDRYEVGIITNGDAYNFAPTEQAQLDFMSLMREYYPVKTYRDLLMALDYFPDLPLPLLLEVLERVHDLNLSFGSQKCIYQTFFEFAYAEYGESKIHQFIGESLDVIGEKLEKFLS